MDILVRARGVRRAYRSGAASVRALDGVDVEIPVGAFAAVTGPSGSGKSTLLHLVGGLERPDEGELEVAGHQLPRLDESELAAFRLRTTGFVFQAFHLIPDLTIEDNVSLPGLLLDRREAEARAAAAELLARVGLAGAGRRYPHQLSGGEQQRAALARALINQPKLILADEPTGNLDSRSGEQIIELLVAAQRAGATLFMATHDLAISSRADLQIQLMDGHIAGRLSAQAPARTNGPRWASPKT